MDNTDPRHHTDAIQGKLDQLITEVRENVYQLDEAPQARALLEVTAEVLTGLKTAYQHYADNSEAAWEGSI